MKERFVPAVVQIFACLCFLCSVQRLLAHELSAQEGGHHDHWIVADASMPMLDGMNQTGQSENAANQATDLMPAIGQHFEPFGKSLQLRWDDHYFYVGSDGLPAHPMMIGIRSWQQQVPIPQKYFGDSAWRIPLRPVPAKDPMTAKNDFLRGAIALAVNGVPIFNPLNNRGEDALQFGELDEYGGHCGRADDYHYHIAPTHLEETTGEGDPIAYALDGYPILSYQDENDADFAPLDDLGGHQDADGLYHYHAQRTYPYLNGGFHGQVTKRDGQVDPQPRAEPVRPALQPLRGATITDFQRNGNRFEIRYDVSGGRGTVAYVVQKEGAVDFTFVELSGATRTESHKHNSQGGPNITGALRFLAPVAAVAAIVALVRWMRSRKIVGDEQAIGLVQNLDQSS